MAFDNRNTMTAKTKKKQRNKSSKHKQQTARRLHQAIIKISNRLDKKPKTN